MDSRPNKRKSRHFTVVARREFPRSAEKAFATWTDPELRRQLLEMGREKKDVVQVEVFEDGYERYDDTWRNNRTATTVRRYLVIQPYKMIIAQAETKMETDYFDQRFMRQELVLFKPKPEGCEIVASNQCVSLQPSFVHAEEEALNEVFDAFGTLL